MKQSKPDQNCFLLYASNDLIKKYKILHSHLVFVIFIAKMLTESFNPFTRITYTTYKWLNVNIHVAKCNLG